MILSWHASSFPCIGKYVGSNDDGDGYGDGDGDGVM